MFLFGNQSGVSESVNGSYEAAHHHVSALEGSPKSRLDGFAFSFEIAILRDADSGAGCFQKFA